jgi:hypothetical protein
VVVGWFEGWLEGWLEGKLVASWVSGTLVMVYMATSSLLYGVNANFASPSATIPSYLLDPDSGAPVGSTSINVSVSRQKMPILLSLYGVKTRHLE